ncbi:MAG: hypothetical protein COA57_04015 [Flavobacteriales bacterium]|nr:MAG: hypothetical protein COA57_04015 [Flavobacteriales bacterium]
MIKINLGLEIKKALPEIPRGLFFFIFLYCYLFILKNKNTAVPDVELQQHIMNIWLNTVFLNFVIRL